MLDSPTRRRSMAVGSEKDLERVLVVVAVTLEGSARRLVTVRSALQVTNNLEETVELRLEPPPFSLCPAKLLRVSPSVTFPIPMSHLVSQVFKINFSHWNLSLTISAIDICSTDGGKITSLLWLLQ